MPAASGAHARAPLRRKTRATHAARRRQAGQRLAPARRPMHRSGTGHRRTTTLTQPALDSPACSSRPWPGRMAVLCGASPTSLSTVRAAAVWACMALEGFWERGEVRAFMPPPSMDRTRTPRPASGERPTARRTASPSPSTASARVAATRTRACTTPSRARAADASGAAASRFHLGLLSSGSAPERSARVCAALSHPHQRPPRATIDSRASPGQPARCSGRPREGHIYSHPDALTALQQGRACLSRRLQRMRALSVTPSQPP